MTAHRRQVEETIDMVREVGETQSLLLHTSFSQSAAPRVDHFFLPFLSPLQEMKLLVEADQPGNQLDDYISRLNAILSQKAAGILNLQARLANFQRRLTEHNVLVSSLAP